MYGNCTPMYGAMKLYIDMEGRSLKLLVIGGGPGGYVAAIRGAQLGADVTLVERWHLGGTCLNVGCIPTKALLHTAELYEAAKGGADCGVIAQVRLDFGRAQAKKAQIVFQLVGGIQGLLAANKVNVISGTARFSGPGAVEVAMKDGRTQKLEADRIIVATGSVPVRPPVPGIDLKCCMDSTGALALEQVPRSMVIIGGGVIGVEMATLYAALGCKVTIVEILDRILPMLDAEITRMVRGTLECKGITIHTGTKVLAVKDSGGHAVVEMEDASGKRQLKAETVLYSTGRAPDNKAVAPEAAGIRTVCGRILVNDRQETNVPGIYAVGDCIGSVMLAHVASIQGEIAAENAVGGDSRYDGRTNPSCVYTAPECASVGITEEDAKQQQIEVVVGRFPLAANGRAQIMGEGGIVKIIAGKQYGEVLGVHIVGPRATDLIAEGALAIGAEATLDEMIETIHAHPTVAEAIREASLAAWDRAIHTVNKHN